MEAANSREEANDASIIRQDLLMSRPAVAQVVPLPVVDAFFGKKYQRRKETVPTTNYR